MTDTSHRTDALLRFGNRARLPVIRQTEATECGLACLAMIACYHGLSIDLAGLRNRASLSARGAQLKELMDVAAGLHLSARPLRAELEALHRLRCPCILHWDMSHFVVLAKCNGKRLVLHDPARGLRKLRLREAAPHFTGVCVELTPSSEFKPARLERRLPLSDLWRRFYGLKRNLVVLLVLSLLLQVYAIASPFYVQTVVDDVVLRNDTGLLQVLALGFGLLLLVETVTEVLRSTVILHLSSRLHLQLGVNLFHHLIRLPLDYFQRRHLGDVLSRFSSIDAVREVLSTGLITAAVDGIMALLTLGVMLLYDWRLTLIVLAALSAYCLMRIVFYRPLRRLTEEYITAGASCETSFIESVRAIQTVKLFQKETERQSQWENRFALAMNKTIGLGRLRIAYGATSTALFGLENLAVVYFAATAVMNNALTLGMLFAFTNYKRRFLEAAESLVDQVIAIKMLSVHLERLADIAYTPKDREFSRARSAPRLRDGGETQAASMELRKLGYRFSPTDAPLFSRLDFRIEPGEIVAITGPSGSGKTTLLKCLMGLLEAEGEVLVDGERIERLFDYRRMIASVMQDDQLLSGTIADNICCFDNQLEPERIAECAAVACVHEDILRLPMQYNTPVGDMGSTLSGGQAQRIMLARALYRSPRLLFLDEATSHLDIDTEARINARIGNLDMTRILVAHRPDTIAMADAIIDLQRDGCDPVSRNGA